MEIKENFVDAAAEACLQTLKRTLGPGVPLRLNRRAGDSRDFDLTIGTKPPLQLFAQTKARTVTRNEALHIILQLKANKGAAIVFADWVPEPVADELRRAGVFFADAQGNVFIRTPPQVIVDIRGNKPERPPRAEPGRLIEPGGLKAIHYLLTHPQAAGNPLRTLAEGAGVGLATAHAVVRELGRKQWILPAAGGHRRFGDRKGLVDLFVRGYALKLRPACVLGRYRHQRRTPHEILESFARRLADAPCGWAVTGGQAAKQLTQYLETDTVELFADDQAMAKLKTEPMLRDDANGNVTILRLFGAAAIADKPYAPWPLATPLLVYAELLENGGAREMETAGMIYDRFLEPELAHGK